MAFEKINKKSREILLKTKDIVQELGYDLIYADTDAAFVHKDNATKDDYEKLGETISKRNWVGLITRISLQVLGVVTFGS